MNEVMECIMNRRSVRSYNDELPTGEQLETIIKAGLYAASGMNDQPWYFAVVQQPQLVAQARELLGSDPFYGANTIIFAFVDPQAHTPMQSVSLALGNMMLAAESLGVCSCWINAPSKGMFDSQQGQAFAGQLGVPAGYRCAGSLAVGFTDQPIPAAKPRRTGTYKIFKCAQQYED